MTSQNDQRPNTADIQPETAAEWVVRVNSDQALRSDMAGLDVWRSASPENQKEYENHLDLWRGVASLSNNPQARALLMRPRRDGAVWTRRLAMAGLATGAAASVAFFVAPRQVIEQQTYVTKRGERRNVVLEDGSALILNTDTAVRVAYDNRERQVFIEHGQAFVRVAKNRQRPFRVFVDGFEVRALGTAFEVFKNRDKSPTQVLLDEGVVGIYKIDVEKNPGSSAKAVRPLPALTQTADQGGAVILQPGQKATFAVNSAIQVDSFDRRVSHAWREGRLIFNETPLAVAVQDVNRYRSRQIVLGEGALSSLSISGVFSVDELDNFVEAITAALPLRVARDDGQTTTLNRR